MSKPYGLSFDLQVQKPSRAMDMIWDAVEQAIIEGMTPKQVKIEMAQAWERHFQDRSNESKEFTA